MPEPSEWIAPRPEQPVKQVYAAISKVRAALAKDGIQKSRTNTQQSYKFRGIDDLYNAAASIMSDHGLCVMPKVTERIVTERATKTGGVLFYVTVRMECSFVSVADGSSHVVVTYGEAMDAADKATNKAMSAGLKYAYLMTLTIPTEADNDADSTTHDVAPAALTPVQQARLESLREIAKTGTEALKTAWKGAGEPMRTALHGELPALKQIALEADKAVPAASPKRRPLPPDHLPDDPPEEQPT